MTNSIFTLRNQYSTHNDFPHVKSPEKDVDFNNMRPEDIVTHFIDWINDELGNHFNSDSPDILQKLNIHVSYLGQNDSNILRPVSVGKNKDAETFDITSLQETEDGKETNFQFAIVVITSTETSLLRTIYNEIQVHKNVKLLLLENNKGDYSSGTQYFIKTGSQALELLTSGKQFNVLKDEDFEKIMQYIKLSDGEYKDETIVQQLLRYFFEGIATRYYIADKLNSLILKVFDASINGIESLKINEEHWNPAKAVGESFRPLFFPFLSFNLVKGELIEENDYVFEESEGMKILTDSLEPITSVIDELFGPKFQIQINDSMLSGNYDKMNEVLSIEFNNSIQKQVAFILREMENLAQQGVIFTNAMIAGFINGVISLVKMLVQIARIPYWLKKEGYIVLSDPESFDEFLQLASTINIQAFFKVFSDLFDKIWDYFSALSLSDIQKMFDISVAQAGYIVGALIEFIVETIVTVYLTYGTVTVATVTREIFAIFEVLYKIIQKVIVGFFKLSKGLTIEGAKLILLLLSKTAEELKLLHDELWLAIKEYLDDLRRTANVSIPLLDPASLKLYEKITKIFYKQFRELLLKLSDDAIMLYRWRKLKSLRSLSPEIITELLEYKSLVKVPRGTNPNVAKLVVRLKVNGKPVVNEFKAISGYKNNPIGFSSSAKKSKMAELLKVTEEELEVLYSTEKYTELMKRFNDAENKMLFAFDDYIHNLKVAHGTNKVKVLEMNLMTLLVPCNSCKKQILIRKDLFKINKVIVEAATDKKLYIESMDVLEKRLNK